MAIDYAVGTKLVAHYHGQRYLAVVAAGEQEDDGLVVQVVDPGKERKALKGKTFGSLSGAGRALTGAKAVGGRGFWTAYEGEPPALPERKARAAAPAEAPAPAPEKAQKTERVPKARSAAAEKVAADNAGSPIKARRAKPPVAPKLITRMDDGRYWCSSCMTSFQPVDDLEPKECPEGHPARAELPDEAEKLAV